MFLAGCVVAGFFTFFGFFGTFFGFNHYTWYGKSTYGYMEWDDSGKSNVSLTDQIHLSKIEKKE